jgi:hypothetical protein
MQDIHARELAIKSHEAKVAEIEAKLLKFEQEGKYQITKDMHEFREQIGFSIGKLEEQHQHIDEKHRNMDAIATNMMNVDVKLKKRETYMTENGILQEKRMCNSTSNNFENWNGSSTTKPMQILFDGIEFHCQCMHKHLDMGKIVSFF